LTDSFQEYVEPLLLDAYRFALSVLHNRDEAEDAVQNAALKAWQAFKRFDRSRAFRPWFLTIVLNECRSQRRRRPWNLLPTYLAGPPVMSEPEDSVEIRLALLQLPLVDRSVVVLRYYLDLPFRDIADVIGSSEPAVRARAYRALRVLRSYLQGRGPGQ
jgi:RNA polymerase sigma factor (sigma-70 family)